MEINQEHPLYKSICSLFDKFYGEERTIRLRRVQQWIRNELNWRGIQYCIWDDSLGSFRFPPDEYMDDLPKVINIFKSHGESIIAALTAGLPFVRFYPNDADNPDDISTARARSKIAEMLEKNCHGKLLLVKALYILYLQDFVASRTYAQKDSKYGVVKTPQIEMQETMGATCVDCGYQGMAGPVVNEPTSLGIEGQSFQGQPACDQCGSANVIQSPQQQPTLVGYHEEPKADTKIEVHGPLYVKIPYYARSQCDVIYLIQASEEHYAKLRAEYPDFRDDIHPGLDTSEYETYARMQAQYYQESNITTQYKCWFKPEAYEVLDVEDRDSLLGLFPKGFRCCFVGAKASKVLVSVEKAILDDEWSIYWRGTSEYLHDDPLGNPLIPIQEIRNDLTNLTLETVQHGIPQIFADPEVLDFDQYQTLEAKPGMVTPGTPSPGKSLAEGFYEAKTTTLSKEVQFFFSQIDQDGQFVVGSFPSVYGGPQEGGGTLGEYELSRNQALQRLNLTWGAISLWWAQTFKNATQCYINHMLEDDLFVKKERNAFINVYIRRSELTGKVGRVEAESSEQLPVSQAQKMSLLMRLIEMQNESLNEVLYSAENSEFVAETLGYPDIYIPGQDQRDKQLEEIQELIMSEPIQMEAMLIPSVQIDQDVDDHGDHVEVLTAFLVGSNGRDLRKINPAGYMNCLAHLQMHKQAQQMEAMQQMAQQQMVMSQGQQGQGQEKGQEGGQGGIQEGA